MPWGEETLDTLSGPHPYSGVILSCSSAKRPWSKRKLHWLSLSREVFQPILSASKKLSFSLHQRSCYIPLLIWTACVPPQQVTMADREHWDHSHILCPLSVNSWHPCSLQTPTNPMHRVAHIQQQFSSRLPASRPVSYALYFLPTLWSSMSVPAPQLDLGPLSQIRLMLGARKTLWLGGWLLTGPST